MTELELSTHLLVKRLKYLLIRLEDEFFHVHPNLDENGSTASLALSSILNEALNLHEASFQGSNFWNEITKWGKEQAWNWDNIEVRFTYWPVLTVLKPFSYDSRKLLKIAGREENNSVKHHGELATLKSVLEACAAAWFIILEKAREAEIFLVESEIIELMKLFDCFDLIDHQDTGFGLVISRPLPNRVEYPSVRGRSEIPLATECYEKRYKSNIRE